MKDISFLQNRKYYIDHTIYHGMIYTYIPINEIEYDELKVFRSKYIQNTDMMIDDIYVVNDLFYRIEIWVGKDLEYLQDTIKILNITEELSYQQTGTFTKDGQKEMYKRKLIPLKKQLNGIEMILEILNRE